MKEIQLTRSMVALVDDDDFDRISKHEWYARIDRYTYYAVRETRSNGHKHTILMHREILNTPFGLLTDHRDRNGLNNQKSNIRICTIAENNKNVNIRKDSSCGIKGVTFKKREKKWSAQIGIGGKIKWLGYFNTPEDAALAYDNANIRLYGEFQSPNKYMGQVAFG
jgi:hypothetical protein